MGTLAPALQAQAEAVEREQDGVRKALGLHSLLRTLVNHKLDALVTLLSPKSLAAVRGEGEEGGGLSMCEARPAKIPTGCSNWIGEVRSPKYRSLMHAPPPPSSGGS